MFSPRDRMLAALFVVQLIAAVCFGGVLIHTLHDHNKPSTHVVSEASTGAAGSVPGATSSTGTVNAGATGGTATSGKAGTTSTGGTVPGTSGGKTATTGKGGKTTTTGATTKISKGAVKPGAPITVGSIVTEEQGINFTASAQATQAYLDMVDAAGGVNGHQIHLLLQNDQLQPAKGLSEAQQMIDEGVFSFVGFNAPETENEIVPFLAKNQIPLVGSYGEYAEYHSPWAYAFSASYGHYGYEAGKYLMKLGVKKPGLIYIDNGSADANTGLVNAFEAGVKAGGGTVNSNAIFKEQPEQPAYDGVVTSMRLAGVDGIATILDESSYNRLQQAMDRQAFHPTHVADPLWPDASVTHEAANNGTYIASDFRFVNPGVGGAVGDYASTVKKAFGSSAQINYIGEQGWLDGEIFVNALKSLGNNITRAGLMHALDAINQPGGYGLTGPLVPTKSAHDINHCLMFGKWNGHATEPTTNWLCDTQPF